MLFNDAEKSNDDEILPDDEKSDSDIVYQSAKWLNGKTSILKDFNKEKGSNPAVLVETDSEIYFGLETSDSGNLLYSTDGTLENTLPIDIFESEPDYHVSSVFVENESVYFATDNNSKVWKKSGENKPELLKEVNSLNGAISFISLKNGKIIFTDGYGLWVTDETKSGTDEILNISETILIKKSEGMDMRFANVPNSPSSPYIVNNNTLYFVTSANSNSEFYLWRTDGTKDGTYKLSELYLKEPENSFFGYIFGPFIQLFNDSVYFTKSENNETAIWKTDGTVDGTKKVFKNFTMIAGEVFKEKLIFITDAGALVKTDGSEEGTEIISEKGDFEYSKFFATEKYLYMVPLYNPGKANATFTLTKTDGTKDGTMLVDSASHTILGDAQAPALPLEITEVLGEKVFYTRNVCTGGGMSQATCNATSYVYDGEKKEPFMNISSSYSKHGLLYFVSEKNLYITDGNEEGTYKLSEDNSLLEVLDIFGVIDDKIIFSGNSPEYGEELFVYEKSEN